MRGGEIGKNKSDYLVPRIDEAPDIEVPTDREIARLFGDTHLESVEIVNPVTGAPGRVLSFCRL